MNENFEVAMRYFELHAKQRISTFNFFVVLSALLTTALIHTFGKDFGHPNLAYPLSIAVMWIPVVFWKLDQRVRFLIKHAEEALRKLEKSNIETDPAFPDLFTAENKKTLAMDLGYFRGIIFHHFSYSQCFGAVYFLFFVIGLLGLVIKILA